MRSAVRWVEVAGYIASSLVFLTFYMRRMVPLRLVALCSNVAFLTYAVALHLAPIAILHGALIPVNIIRLVGALREDAGNRRGGDPNASRYLPRRSGIAWPRRSLQSSNGWTPRRRSTRTGVRRGRSRDSL